MINKKVVKKIIPTALFGSVIISNFSVSVWANAGRELDKIDDNAGAGSLMSDKSKLKKITKIDPNDPEELREISERKRQKRSGDIDIEDIYKFKRSFPNDQGQDVVKQENTKMEIEEEYDKLYDINIDDTDAMTVTRSPLGYYVGGGLRFKIINKLGNTVKTATIIGVDTRYNKLDKGNNNTLKEVNVSKIKYNGLEYDVTDVESTAFYKCVSLETVILPNVERIHGSAFIHCEKLKLIELPKLGEMGTGNFLNCKSLERVKLSWVLFADMIDSGDKKLEDVVFEFVDNEIEDYEPFEGDEDNLYKDLIYRLNHKNKTVELIEVIDGNPYLQDWADINEVDVYGAKYKVVKRISSKYDSNNLVYELNHTDKTADIIDVVNGKLIAGDLNIPGNINFSGTNYKVEKINSYVFDGCEALTQVTINEGIIELEDNVFRNCINLNNVILPNSLNKLGSEVFKNCYNLAKIILPTSTGSSTIKEWYYWDSEESVEGSVDGAIIKDTANDIDYTCNSFTAKFYRDIVDGIKYNITSDGAVIIGYDECKINANVVIPEKLMIDGLEYDVVEIEKEAFSNCTKIKSVNIPKSMKKIGEYAFFSCECLRDVKIQEGVKKIGENAFQYCMLEYFEIPNSVEYLGQETFLGCCNLKNVKIGTGLTELLSQTFGDCEKLDGILIPNNINFVAEDIFASDMKPGINFKIFEYSRDEKFYKKDLSFYKN